MFFRITAYLLPPILILGAVVLIFFDPAAEGAAYPPCVFHRVGHLHCPGCGSTRSLSRLIRLDIFGAWSYNPLVVLALPLLGYQLLAFEIKVLANRQLPMPTVKPLAVRAIFVAIILFWLARNLPFAPFSHLAPGGG